MKTISLLIVISFSLLSSFNAFSQCAVSLTVSTTDAVCGQANGTATVVATGGTGPYTYHWTNGDLTATADSLAANLYMIMVTDSVGCSKTAPAMINSIGSPTISVTGTTNVSCHGGNDGGINISVAGGITPYTYNWVNGATTQDVSNLVAGPYQVAVIGADGCLSMKNILVNEPAPLTLSVTTNNASCGIPNGGAVVIANGGGGNYTYQWSNGASTAGITGLAAGGYSVQVTSGNGCTNVAMAPIINTGAAVISVDSVKPAPCGTGVGSVYISVNGGVPPYTYAWSNGSTAQDLVNVPPGPYSLMVSGGNTCYGSYMGVVPSKAPNPPVICLVTVDSLADKNVCVFKKDTAANPGLSHYNFYRESIVAGQYQLLGSKPANMPSIWTDQSANPVQHAWRYRVTAVDTCGNESAPSNYHKTVHLSANIGLNNRVNLIWDDYEGFAVPTYVIYRYTVASGWDSLDAVSGNVHAYTDVNPPVPLINVHYMVAIKLQSPCKLNSKNPVPMGSNLNLSKSNVNRINPVTTGLDPVDDLAGSVLISPNPSTGQFIINSPKYQLAIAEVYDLMGREILSESLENGNLILNLAAEQNGIYFVKIISEAGVFTRKVILNK